MKKITCIGHAAYDITFPLNSFPEENSKNRVKKIVECGGGPASNAAYLLGKWKMDTTFIGIVGSDIYGKKIKDELKSVDVNIDYMEESKKYATTISVVITSKKNNTRTTLAYKNPNMKIINSNINIKTDVILIDGQEYELSKKIMNDNPSAIKIIDAGRNTEEILDLCKYVDYIVCSKEFAEEITNIKFNYHDTNTFNSIFEKLIELYPNKKYVITLEDKGCMFLDGEYVKVMPTYKVDVKDTTGAGDIFHGAFTYAIANNYSLENAVKLGNIAGALSVTKLGTRNSVPSIEEVMKLYEK